MHSSNSSNMEAQFSVGRSGVNFTAERMSDCDCSELHRYPGHVYSVAVPWVILFFFFSMEESERSKSETQSQTFHLFLSLHSLLWAFFLYPLSASLTLSTFLYHEESREDWLEQLKLRGRWGPGLRVSGVCKAGLIPLKCCFTCP